MVIDSDLGPAASYTSWS